MDNLNLIGLDAGKVTHLAEGLNDLLANYHVFYQNVRGYHWNIKGGNFFELHAKFEELYNDLVEKIDEVAERILTLGHTPGNAFSRFLQVSEIPERSDITDGKEAVNEILKSFRVLIIKQRQLLEESDKVGDEGTNALVSEYIRGQEKLVWMYSSYLNK